MSEYSALKATINANVKANNNQEITGAIMNSVLNAMVNSLGAGYQFIGVATPTNPGTAQTPDYKCFYLATTPGTYTNLRGLVVADGEVALLKWDTSWTKEVTGIASADKLNQLGQETININSNIAGKLPNIIDFANVAPTTVIGLIPEKSSKKFSSSSSTGYGVAYISAEAGKVYRMINSSKEWYAAYIAIGFCANVPSSGVSIDESIKTFDSTTTTALDILYCPTKDGYLFILYSTGISYSFAEQIGLKEIYSKSEINEINDKEVFRTDRVALNIGLSDAKRIYNMQDITLSSSVGTSISNGGRINITGNPSADYGVVFFAVSAGKTYALKASNKACLSDYANVAFSTVPLTDGALVDSVISQYSSATQSYNLLYTAVANGYIFLTYYNNETTIWSAKEVLSTCHLEMDIEDIQQKISLSAELGHFVVNTNTKQLKTAELTAAQSGKYLITCESGYYASIKVVDKVSVFTWSSAFYVEMSKGDSFTILLKQLPEVNYSGYTQTQIDSVVEASSIKMEYLGISNRLNGVEDVAGLLSSYFIRKDIGIDRSGFGRIGSAAYSGNLSNKFQQSNYIPICAYKTLIAYVKGNNEIDVISFFDKNYNYISALKVVGTSSLAMYRIDLSGEEYENVEYVQIGAYDNDADFSTMYAYLEQQYNLDTIRLVKYKKILCIGDSLTNSVQYSGQKRWVQYVQELLSIGARATSGTSGANMSNNGNDSIYATIQASTADTDVDIITLWGGTNDWGSNIPIGDFDTQIVDETRDTTTFYGGLIANVLKLISLYPAKRIILIGTTPRTWNSGTSDYNNTPNAGGKYLRDYVDAVKKVAEWFGLPFLDLLHTSGINAKNISQYMYQQTSGGVTYYLHFNDNGEKQMGNRIASFIDSIG